MMAKSATISWKGFLSVNNAEAIKEELEKKLSKDDSLTIDISNADDIDVSIIQLMYAAFKEAAALQKKLSITGTFKPDVRRCLYVCGIIENDAMPDADIAAKLNALGGTQS
ncbi:MAG: STAS domain-containing protein [Spirochaetaceae bacterium]|jgi:anti-anti-sigma regulatory factor|nr:STAS domain-containing protein [Spirochaetaceae bacterium]